MIRQYELVEAVRAYDPSADEDLLNRAYVFAMKAHGTQTRDSGDLYFTHPLEVAGILVEMRLDVATIATALLHDTVEDTIATLEEIEKLFGKEVAFLVDGVTKLSQIEFQSDKAKQAENFRKLLIAMSSDIRVLLIKLADRLHNMRTLHFVESEEKRMRVSQETMEIYAPLAERIGLHRVKDDLQNLAFAQLHPDAYQSIVSRLRFLREQEKDILTPIIEELKQVLEENGIKAFVAGREKKPYSIWRKMQQRNITFDQLSDIIAFRVLVDTSSDCYRSLGVIHSTYPVVPGRFKDYISTPKQNNYQSIHTAVIGPNQHRIEIQIRTNDMEEIAELGVAAHWQYKQGISHDGRQYRFLRDLLDILEKAEGPEEFLEQTKLEMFQDQVFCFTPKGDLITLPRGATAIDFAYAVHSSIGDHCTGVRINGRVMPLRTELENGDQIEIVTSKTQHPSPTWERFVVTGKARASIRRFIRQQKRQQFLDLGKTLAQKAFRHEHLDFNEKFLAAAIEPFGVKTVEDVYAYLGEGLKTTSELIRILFPQHKPKARLKKGVPKRELAKKHKEEALAISGLIPGMAVHYAGCCHAVPGDHIVGIVTTGKGVTIHTSDCETLEKFMDTPERWIDVAWTGTSPEHPQHVARISLVVIHQPGTIAAITAIIARENANIINFKIKNRTQEFYEVSIDLDVKNLDHLMGIIAALRMSQRVLSVERG
ncbi:MAG: bifunctional (p)ppGpp synthetase/guanosine-3',5'-bis(diphosphate) 3'-pyrophosphohydrolase [Alphaproteobacteria bacterium 41-28]|nr:MAG: bifunctional (p)ppGpp synthetase/guanosine-3',5'-bis(diphosphate) 3'-pyrophosphohydrolase [Alphaproteobacteria bacterium 41-28]